MSKFKDFTKAEKKKYLKNSSVCPKCGSENIEGSSIEVDAGCAWQEIVCNDCGIGWNDIYNLVDVELVDSN